MIHYPLKMNQIKLLQFNDNHKLKEREREENYKKNNN